MTATQAEILANVRNKALESAAVLAETCGVHPALNVYNGGPEWYKHGKIIAGQIRALKTPEAT